MGRRLVAVLFGAVSLLALCTLLTHDGEHGSTHHLFLLPMTGALTLQPTTHLTRSVPPIAQAVAPAPVKTKPKVKKPDVGSQRRSRVAPVKPKMEPPKNKVRKASPNLARQTQSQNVEPKAVVLLGDEGYDEDFVVEQLRAVIPDLKQDAKKAVDVFNTAQEQGRGFACIADKDAAELMVSRLQKTIPVIYAITEDPVKGGGDEGTAGGGE